MNELMPPDGFADEQEGPPDGFADQVKPEYSQGFFKTYEGKPQGALQNIDVGLGKAANFATQSLSAPFEIAGESIRTAAEGIAGNPTEFRSPALFRGSNDQNPPAADTFSYANKLIRSGTDGITAPLRGQSITQQAQAEYNRPPNAVDTVSDIATGIGSSLIFPRASNAPMEAVTQGAGKLFSNVMPASKFVGKKVLSSAFGPSEEALSTRFNQPAKLLKARPFQDLGDELANDLNSINKQISDESTKAWDSLLKLKSEPRDKVVNFLNSLKKDLNVKGGGPLGSDNQRAAREIDTFLSGIPKQKGVSKNQAQFLDQEQLKQIVQAADNQANWANPEPTASERAFRTFRGKLNEYLRNENPQYAEIMDPINKKIEFVDNLSNAFSMEKSVGQGNKLRKKDITAQKFPLFLDEKRSRTREYLGKLKEITGKDYLEESKMTKLSDQFDGGKANGARRTLAFGGAGALADMLIPGSSGISTSLGMLFGALSDNYGGNIAGSIVDNLRKYNPEQLATLKTPEAVSAFVNSLQKSGVVSTQIQKAPNEITQEQAREYLKKAGGDRNKAREMAAKDGHTWKGKK